MKRFDANKVVVKAKGEYPYIVRTSRNNGQKGYIDEDKQYLNEGNTIAFGQDTATMFYQEKPYFTGDKIKVLRSKLSRFNKNNAQFFIVAMRKPFELFSWGTSSYNVEIIKNQRIVLPVRDGEIDFDFMESFIAELEAERIAELSAYLTVSGFDNYELSDAELRALQEYSNLEFNEFDILDIFTVKNTSNLLASDIVENSGKTPYLCASSENNGVSSYIEYNKDYLEEGNCIFIGGKTFVVSYQENDFFSNDSHNLALYLNDSNMRTKLNQLYITTCVLKSLSHKYSWGNSVSKAKIKCDKISLPAKNGRPNFAIMKTFISAIQKLVIKEVVLYSDRKIAATKEVISRSYQMDD